MASTRDFISLGKFAKNADEVQEPNVPERVPGESFRNTSFTTFQQEIGKQFNIIPVSENVNQQIFNQTKFTDLIDKQGIPGWSEEVTYNKPAVVHASDGKLYFNKRDGNINVDPVGTINEDEEWWGEFIGAENLDNIYASEVEGDEGARLVGVTNTPNEIKFPRVGETLQNALERNEKLLADNMKNVNILASGFFTVFNNGTITITKSHNITSGVITNYSKTADIRNGTVNRIGYVTINFTNPIDTPYLYMLSVENFIFFITSSQDKILLHQTSNSIADPTSTSIKIGSLMLANRQGVDIPAGSWPPVWGVEDPASREIWKINLTCFVID